MSPETTASAADSNSASGEFARASASMCAENFGQLDEVVESGEEELRVGERTRGGRVRRSVRCRARRARSCRPRGRSPFGTAVGSGPRSGWSVRRPSLSVECRQRLEPLSGPRANGSAIAGLARFERGSSPGCGTARGSLWAGAGGRRCRAVAHTNLLSRDRPESARDRAGKKVRTFELCAAGGHGPFRGLVAPLALCLELTENAASRQPAFSAR